MEQSDPDGKDLTRLAPDAHFLHPGLNLLLKPGDRSPVLDTPKTICFKLGKICMVLPQPCPEHGWKLWNEAPKDTHSRKFMS